MTLPPAFLQSIQNATGFDKESFINVHLSGRQITSIRQNPFKTSKDFIVATTRIPWAESGFYLAERPSFTFDPLFHAGCYYVQEASSMFLEQAIKQTVDLSKPLRVLDLCAAPGGKSTHIQSLITGESLLVSNEVIRSRANILKDNIIKWGASNVVVTNNDPADFSRLENYFDVIVVDAPCSGSGLFRRDPEAIDEWSENNVALCSQRQQRILADIWPALKKDGILIYSTCSYSVEEDEQIMDWLSEHFEVGNRRLNIQPEWKITESLTSKGNTGYRFWPDKVKGEGFFLSVFQKISGEEETDLRVKKKPTAVTKGELSMIHCWVKPEGLSFIKHENTVYAWPEMLVDDLQFLLERTRVIYSGTLTGELMRDKLVPDHALAMSKLMKDDINRFALNREQSIAYLQRKNLLINNQTKGWQLVTYADQPLGWINNLENRVNNYYPKELRILKDTEKQ